MRTHKFVPAASSLLLGLLITAQAPAQDAAPAKPEASAKPDAPAAAPDAKAPEAKPAPEPGPATADKPLRLNFRNAPLDMVLNYLSEAAGFIIVSEAEVRGKIDVWSNQPVTQEEALAVLDSALNKNGLTALRNGRTLTIVTKENAKRRDIPVKSGNDPEAIPKNEELVTQIIPIHFITATQLVQNLQPLLPTGSEMTANEAGNALVLTDTQVSIKRMTEIIRALDTSMAGATTIKVFPLRYSDAKELATLVKELFPSQANAGANSRNGGAAGGGFGGFGGGPFGGGGRGGGGGGGGGGAAGGNTAGSGRAAASRVTAVADEHSNSLVVNAPEDVLPAIEELVKKVDRNVEDITEVRAFRLKYADPVEMADLLTSLFPDETQNANNTGGNQVRFGGGFGGRGGGGGGATAPSGDSELARKKGKVLAVPDPRTGSVIVKAARDLMGQISQMVEQLDSNPAKKQKVYVYELDNADPTEVETVLRSLFESKNTQNRSTQNRTTQNQGSALTTRQTQNQNQNRGTTTGFGQGGAGQTGRQN